jgi:hypothetical protein
MSDDEISKREISQNEELRGDSFSERLKNAVHDTRMAARS